MNPYQPPETKPAPSPKPFDYIIAASIVFMLVSCGVLALSMAVAIVGGLFL